MDPNPKHWPVQVICCLHIWIKWSSKDRPFDIAPLSENEEWKLQLIEEVSLLLKGQLKTDFDDEPLLEEILDFVCTT